VKLAYLETDASLDTRHATMSGDAPSYPAGAGIVLRDVGLKPVLLKSVLLGNLPDPFHAEYLAFVFGLEEAVALGASGVWATSDSQHLVQVFNGLGRSRAKDLEPIETRLESVRRRLGFVTLRWSRGSHRTSKFGSPSADSLARAALGLGKRK
jgi:ribonuclease HI